MACSSRGCERKGGKSKGKESHGYRPRLHSQQPDYPAGSLKDLGLTHEPKRLFLSKWLVNTFFRRIGLSMRRGTAKSAETQPEQIESFRVIMMRRLLDVTVIHVIIPALVFQFDETGISPLGFGKEGRAQQGASQVTLRGLDDKRQVTASIVIDGENNFVSPIQIIWEGAEGSSVACEADMWTRNMLSGCATHKPRHTGQR